MAGRHNFSGRQSALDSYRGVIGQQLQRANELRDEAKQIITDPEIMGELIRRYNNLAEVIDAYSKALENWKKSHTEGRR